MMRRFLLMLTAVMLVLGAFMTSPERASAAAAEPPTLAASVTSDATVARTYGRSLSQKKIVTQGRALSPVSLKVGPTRLDRIRIPQRCEAPVVLPDTGLRAASR